MQNHGRDADRLWDELTTLRVQLIKNSPTTNLPDIKQKLAKLEVTLGRAIIFTDISGLSESLDKGHLAAAKKELDNDFEAMRSASDSGVLINSLKSGIERCEAIGGVRMAYFTRLADALQS